MDGEVGGQTDSLGIFAQEPRPNAVKRSRPWECDELTAARINKRVKNTTRATFEIHRCTPAERQQQQTMGICAFAYEIGDAMGERVGLSRASARDDQQRRRVCIQRAVNGCSALRVVERRKGIDFHSVATDVSSMSQRGARTIVR